MKTISFHTLGCKMNQAETQRMKETVLALGLEIADHRTPSDIAVVNTCTVTQAADKKSGQAIRSLAKRCGKVIVTGCFANINEKKPLFDRENIVFLKDKSKIKETVESFLPAFSYSDIEHSVLQNTVRANLIIQNGCNNFCSYCIVPYARGREVSYPIGKILAQAEKYAETGIKELVLTGINTGAHGDLPLLLEKLSVIGGILRIRISSVEPLNISDDLLGQISSDKKICRHLHIPLQSGDDKVLKLMNRNYTGDDYANIIEKIRSRMPDIAISTDIIIGFPGETRSQFDNTVEFIKKTGFSRLHIFRFSPRPGTSAEKMSGRVNPKELSERAAEIKRVRSDLMASFHNKLKGQTVEVLIEPRDKRTGLLEGLTSDYVRVFMNGGDELIGSIVLAKVEKTGVESVFGEQILSQPNRISTA